MIIGMAQTHDGAIKIAAKKAGVSEAEYRRLLDSGMKWCTLCQAWHPRSEFGSDTSRWDGLTASCRDSRCAKSRAEYLPRPRARGRSFVPARDGDQKQARRRVNFFVEQGLLPHPNVLPCADCGHEWETGGRRHEYDHHLGYDAEHHEHVEPVCTRCHARREARRALEGRVPHKRRKARGTASDASG